MATKSFIQVLYIGDGKKMFPGISEEDFRKVSDIAISDFEDFEDSLRLSKTPKKLGSLKCDNPEIFLGVYRVMEGLHQKAKISGVPASESILNFWNYNPSVFFFLFLITPSSCPSLLDFLLAPFSLVPH
jgi:hypothetical protein